MKRFPALELFAKYGRPISLLALASGAIIALAGALWEQSPIAAIMGMIIAIILSCVLRILAELVEVIVDTLIPR